MNLEMFRLPMLGNVIQQRLLIRETFVTTVALVRLVGLMAARVALKFEVQFM